MSEFVSPGSGYAVVEREPAEVMGRNLKMASKLWASATAFFFFAFLFAYFYLRAVDKSSVFRPKHIDPSMTLGTLVMLAVVAGAVVVRLGLADHRAGRQGSCRTKETGALVLLLAALVLQVVEWSSLGFGPTDGPYASVFIGWTGMQFLFLIGVTYWVETTVAMSMRYRGERAAAAENASGDAERAAPDIEDPLSLLGPELDAASFYAAFVAGLVVLAWVVLYLV